MRLTNWFEISDQDYIWYKLQGYTIDAGEGRIIWYLDNEYHRTDGPAVIYHNGTQWWYLNGKLHCTDGPAYIDANGTRSWWINGIKYTEQEWLNAVNELV